MTAEVNFSKLPEIEAQPLTGEALEEAVFGTGVTIARVQECSRKILGITGPIAQADGQRPESPSTLQRNVSDLTSSPRSDSQDFRVAKALQKKEAPRTSQEGATLARLVLGAGVPDVRALHQQAEEMFETGAEEGRTQLCTDLKKCATQLAFSNPVIARTLEVDADLLQSDFLWVSEDDPYKKTSA